MLVNFGYCIKTEEKKDGKIYHLPVFMLNGEEVYISEQGSIVMFEDREGAQEYIDDLD